jgi:prefoldin subunit 5
MPYGTESIENRFDDFVEETNKKIEELEARIRSLQMELDKIKTVKNVTTVVNQEMRGSLGATIKSVRDIVK